MWPCGMTVPACLATCSLGKSRSHWATSHHLKNAMLGKLSVAVGMLVWIFGLLKVGFYIVDIVFKSSLWVN